ncbi:unnamed protein product, partial [Polarella glacialis]
MPREREGVGIERDPHAQRESKEDDASESLVDKLKGGDFSNVIESAQKAGEAAIEQQLCLTAGGIKRADPHTAFAYQTHAPPPEDPEDEMLRLRQARKMEMQAQQAWKQQGHGSLRELKDEKEFVEAIRPHERALVLLDDGRSDAGEECRKALSRLSRSHLEAQFCWLHSDRAKFLTEMVKLEGFPAIFVLRNGEVQRMLPPDLLFMHASASSPLFIGHLTSLLHR